MDGRRPCFTWRRDFLADLLAEAPPSADVDVPGRDTPHGFLTLTALGHRFDRSAFAVGTCLKALGLREDDGRPTLHAITEQLAFVQPTFRGHLTTLWDGERVSDALKRHGWTEVPLQVQLEYRAVDLIRFRWRAALGAEHAQVRKDCAEFVIRQFAALARDHGHAETFVARLVPALAHLGFSLTDLGPLLDAVGVTSAQCLSAHRALHLEAVLPALPHAQARPRL